MHNPDYPICQGGVAWHLPGSHGWVLHWMIAGDLSLAASKIVKLFCEAKVVELISPRYRAITDAVWIPPGGRDHAVPEVTSSIRFISLGQKNSPSPEANQKAH